MMNWLRQLTVDGGLDAATAEDPDIELVAAPKPPHLADVWRAYNPSPHNYDWGISAASDTALLRRYYAAAVAALAAGSTAPMKIGTTCTDRTKILIYGAGLYREEAEPIFNDPTWEVQAINLCVPLDARGRLRADVWFDLHQRCAQSVQDLRWIKECPFPIYVPPDLLDASPMAVPFPLGAIEQEFGSYFACTFAYQIALVLWQRRHGREITDLALYGVELAWGPKRERTVEWACTAYWLGRAEEAGLQIHLPSKSTLGRHFGRYGFEYEREKADVEEYVRYTEDCDALRKRLGVTDGHTGG